MNRMKWFFQSGNHAGGLIARITLALVILPHGLQLLLGWFGGYGFTASMEYFTSTVRLPWLVGFLVILLQSFGALFLLAGFATRPLALATIFLFAGMIFTAHLEFGFFMNWYGTQKGEGFEFHLLVIGLALLLFLDGAGKYSFDSLLAKSFFKSQNQPA
jgi:putative oxidoreductase